MRSKDKSDRGTDVDKGDYRDPGGKVPSFYRDGLPLDEGALGGAPTAVCEEGTGLGSVRGDSTEEVNGRPRQDLFSGRFGQMTFRGWDYRSVREEEVRTID